jgi:hypothetical protein
MICVVESQDVLGDDDSVDNGSEDGGELEQEAPMIYIEDTDETDESELETKLVDLVSS